MIFENLKWDDVALIATSLYSIASVIARLTPSPKDEEALEKLEKSKIVRGISEMLRIILIARR